MDLLSPSHFDKVCRACLVPATSRAIQLHKITADYLQDLFGDRDPTIALFHSELPKQLCSGCLKKCEKWLSFRMLFEDNHKILVAIADPTKYGIPPVDDPEGVEELPDEDVSGNETLEVIVQQSSNDLVDQVYTITAYRDEDGEEVELQAEAEGMEDNDEATEGEEEEVHVEKKRKLRKPSPKKKQQDVVKQDPDMEVPEVFPLLYLECAICRTEVEHSQEYRKHLLAHHVTGHSFNCELCKDTASAITSKEAYIQHIYSHTKFRFRCPFKCATKMSARTSVNGHMKYTHKIDYTVKFRQCHICGAFSKTDQELKKHFLQHITPSEPGKFDCFMCPTTFEVNRQLAAHLYTHVYAPTGNICCELCGHVVKTKENLHRHMDTHHAPEREKHQCDVCGKSYKNSLYLRHHKLRHKLEKTIKCPDCEKLFYTQRDLNTHVKTHNPNNRSYICTYCDRGFFNMSVLKEHVRIRHTGERGFPCDQCDRSYYRSRELIEHQRSHTGEKPFSCEVCHRIYARKTTLMTHMKTHR